MSDTTRGWWNGRDNSPKKKKDRKRFVYRGENRATKSNGGSGNKRCWQFKLIPKWLYKKYREGKEDID